jgi:hypothetical protein
MKYVGWLRTEQYQLPLSPLLPLLVWRVVTTFGFLTVLDDFGSVFLYRGRGLDVAEFQTFYGAIRIAKHNSEDLVLVLDFCLLEMGRSETTWSISGASLFSDIRKSGLADFIPTLGD